MSEFTGKICPYCRTEFQEGDDIVVCSSCEMPHHKDCWIDNQGCTTFGCSGTIRGIDGSAIPFPMQSYPPTAESMPRFQSPPYAPQPGVATMGAAATSALPEYIFCRICGQRCRSTDTFCIKCGTKHIIPGAASGEPASSPAYAAAAAPSYAPYTPSTPREASVYAGCDSQTVYPGYGYQTGDLSREEALFIGKNVEFYRLKLLELREKHSKASWNWSSFLFSIYWCFYRKMYGLGTILIVVDVITSLLPIPFLYLGVSITMGILGNYFYMNHMRSKLDSLHGLYAEARMDAIKKKGGVSTVACVLIIVLVFIINFINFSITYYG